MTHLGHLRPHWLRPAAALAVVAAYGVVVAALAMSRPDRSGQAQPVELVRDLEVASDGSTQAQAGIDALARAVPSPEPAVEPTFSLPRLEAAIPPPLPQPPPEVAMTLPRLEDVLAPPFPDAPPVVLPPPMPPPRPQPRKEKDVERARPRPDPAPATAAPPSGGAAQRPSTAPVGSAAATGDVAARAAGAGSEGDPALARYAAQVHRLLQARANAMGLENMSGIVSITFVIDEAGRVRSHDLSRPSGDQHIDRAMRKLMGSTTFPPPPGGRFSGTVTIRIR